MSDMHFEQLKDNTELTAENLDHLACLIYETDPYIYPAMFGSCDNARALLPFLLENRDSMFKLSNCFAAMDGKAVIGLVLWVRDFLDWSPVLLKQAYAHYGIAVSPHLDLVAAEYVGSYNEKKTETVNIINVCVLKEHRGKGVGEKMLKAFLEETPSPVYELCVLKENERAVRLYESLGFQAYEEYRGFTVDDTVVKAYKMIRKNEKQI